MPALAESRLLEWWRTRSLRLAGRIHAQPRNAASLDKAADAPLCVMVIDLDGFKAINDTYGHSVGDEVLVRTAERIRGSVRDDAVVVRWGGEEFVVVDRLAEAEVSAVAERIRTDVAASAQPATTVSIGSATAW